MRIDIEITKGKILIMIICCGSNEDVKITEQNKFWEELQEAVDENTAFMLRTGDINIRVVTENMIEME